MLRSVFVYSNRDKDQDGEKRRYVEDFLKSQGVEVQSLSEETPKPYQADLAIVLGGDGTMIRLAHLLLGTGIPIIGINLGRLGYMAEIEWNKVEECLQKAIRGDFTVEERLMLEARIGNDPKTYFAVNDFAIHRDLSDGILAIRCEINGHFLADFQADGIIIASPCGSTAYNFSAGGPILNPVSDNLILTPLCAHGLLDRSIVLRGDDHLDFYIGSFSKADQAAFIGDGGRVIPIPADTWIHVYKSRYSFPLAKVSDMSFFEIVQKKMRP
ncbi:MAG: NAD(+)/NADH kinase [Firmicutes bacterium]|nr:NAD(+)/NADH kinase [Bacillota bacterium]